MSLLDALEKLKEISLPVVQTNDAAALWKVMPATASKTLERLAASGHIIRLQRGIWVVKPEAHPWALAPYLTGPSPCYISLQTALFHHGMIEQIPAITHILSFARPREVLTPFGTYAIHKVHPSYFFGFEPFADTTVQMATPEKALIDFLYFSPTKTRAFRSLPELELPKIFNVRRARQIVSRIEFPARRNLVKQLLQEITCSVRHAVR